MSLLLKLVAIGLVVSAWIAWVQISTKPTLRETPDGMIVHSKYGTYPKSVPFKEGMTLYPGQDATLRIVTHLIKKDKDEEDHP